MSTEGASSVPSPLEGEGWGGGSSAEARSARSNRTPTPNPSPASGRSRPSSTGYGGGEHTERTATAPTLTHVVTTLAALGKSELPAQLAAWLDALDETGRWALLKLVTGALRIGVSARLAKTAVARIGGKEPDEIELIWPTLAPPYTELFAWIEGRA